MCEYASFCVGKLPSPLRVYVGMSLFSHEGIEAGHGLKPGAYREAEWTADGPASLTVRVEAGELAEDYRNAILRTYPTRAKLFAVLTLGRGPNGSTMQYRVGKLHGLMQLRDADGKLHRKVHYKADKLHGVCQTWYANGKLWSEDHYKAGELHGVGREWYEDGTLWSEYHYIAGKRHGRWREWYMNGKLQSEDRYIAGKQV